MRKATIKFIKDDKDGHWIIDPPVSKDDVIKPVWPRKEISFTINKEHK
jgi:hypothetical protein